MTTSYSGYCLTSFKQGESNLICHLLTEGEVVSFIVRGCLKPKAKIRKALFQPLAFLDCVLSSSSKSSLHIAQEVKLKNPKKLINNSLSDAMQMLFMAEVALVTARQGATAEIWSVLENAEEQKHNESDPKRHILFLVNIIEVLGILPSNLDAGSGQSSYFSPSELMVLETIVNGRFFADTNGRIERKEALDILMKYLQFFYAPFKTIKSVEVLKSLF
jgi:recombinational DNA repair protein (RecF pathway)